MPVFSTTPYRGFHVEHYWQVYMGFKMNDGQLKPFEG